MKIYFSKIEDYINNNLSEKDRKGFENELNSNKQLKERYEFYKNFQKIQKQEKPKPIVFEKKILPEIKNLDFSEKKPTKKLPYTLMSAVAAVFLIISFVFINNSGQNINIKKPNIANLALAIDSLKKINEKTENDYLALEKAKNKAQELLANISKNETKIKFELEKKQSEIKDLKNEIAQTKQDYYEEINRLAGSGSNEDDSLEITRIRIWRKPYFKFFWKSKKIYKVKIFNQKRELIDESRKFQKNNYKPKKLEYGFYFFQLIDKKNKTSEYLIEINKTKSKVWDLIYIKA